VNFDRLGTLPMRVQMLRYTIARESASDVFAPGAGGTYQLGDFDCIADPVTLIAKPRGDYATAEEARRALEPHLDSWAAKAELIDQIPMSFHFVGSEMADRRPQPGGGDAIDPVVFDAVGSQRSDTVTLIRVIGDLPAPDPRWQGESPLARELRLRARELADSPSLPAVAYAMYDGIKAKYGGPGRAAVSLGVSTGLLEQVSRLAGGARDRKPTNPITLSDEQRVWLLQAMRVLARRVAEVEAGVGSLPTLTQANIRR
jgi:hypothetical protein